MFRRTFASVIAIASMLSGQVTTGNTGSGGNGSYPQQPVSFEDVKKFLALTDLQLQQLRGLLDELTSGSQGRFEKVEAVRAERDNLLRTGSRDVTRIGQLTLDLYTLINQPPVAPDELRRRARAVLIPQQRTLLDQLEQASRLAAAASQAVALNLLDAPLPPAALSPMPLLP